MFKIAYTPIFKHPLPGNHRFPMEKYELLPEQLLYEQTVNHNNFFEPGKIDTAIVLQTHCPIYFNRLTHLQLTRQEERRTGFIHNELLINRELTIMQGTLEAALFALEFGVAMNIAGGTHHAYKDKGEGFCLLNDIAIAANYLLHHQLASRILVIDLDVHQGNGTAKIFEGNPHVFTFSMHGAHNYPMHKEQSDLDVGLPDGITDAPYMALLDKHLKTLLDTVQPNFIFYQSGVDVLATDKLGRLGLTIQGCKERDRLVLDACYRNNIPVCASMGGGYSPDIKHIVEAHANTYRLAQELFF